MSRQFSIRRFGKGTKNKMFIGVTCQDPVPAISKMGGRVLNYEHTTAYYYNATLMFACGSDQRLLGSEIRTCMGDGKWSGVNTVCDNIGNSM